MEPEDGESERPREPRAAPRAMPRAPFFLAATLLVAAQWIGGLYTEGLVVAGVLALATLFVAWRENPTWEPRPGAAAIVLLGIGTIAFTAFQLVPLPPGVLRMLAPDTAAIYADALRPLGATNLGMHPISLDPASTRVALAQGAFLLVLFLATVRIADKREDIFLLERVLVVSAVAMGIAALIHPAFGMTKVFGIYAPEMEKGAHTAPLLNSNHLAAYLNGGAILCFGIVLSANPSIPRSIAAVISLLLVAASVATGSRGGFLSLGIGLAAVAIVARHGKRRHESFARYALPALILAGLVALLAIAAFDPVSVELLDRDTSKLSLAKQALAYGWTQRWVGVGRGAFEPAFVGFLGTRDNYVFTHPENLPAQLLTEWGLPVALLFVVTLLTALRPRNVFERSHLPAGAYGALVAAGIHNLVDFNSEVPGIAAIFAVCAALVVGGRTARPTTITTAARRVGDSFGLGGVAAVSALIFIVAFAGRSKERSREAMELRVASDAVFEKHAPLAPFLDALGPALARHPADGYFALLGASAAGASGDPRALAFADRALARNPHSGRVHLILARWFFRRNPSQARLEYRLSFQEDRTTFPYVSAESPFLVGSYFHAMELVPRGGTSITGEETNELGNGTRGALAGPEVQERALLMLDAISSAIANRLPATRTRIDAEISRRDPRRNDLVERRANDLFHDVKTPEAWCAASATANADPRALCIQTGLALAATLREREPRKCRGHALTAAFEAAAGNRGALATFATHVDEVDDRAFCLRALADRYAEVGDDAHLENANDRLGRLGCNQPEECVENLMHAATLERSRKRLVRAISFVKKAAERAPERDDLYETWAAWAEESGAWGEAATLWSKLGARHPEGPFLQRAADARGHVAAPVVLPTSTRSASP